MFDEDKSGQIDEDEFFFLLQYLGLEVNNQPQTALRASWPFENLQRSGEPSVFVMHATYPLDVALWRAVLRRVLPARSTAPHIRDTWHERNDFVLEGSASVLAALYQSHLTLCLLKSSSLGVVVNNHRCRQ